MAGHPLPGWRLLHAIAVSRKYTQRVRCSRFPPTVAILRICAEAPWRMACDSTEYPCCTFALLATSELRTMAPMLMWPFDAVSMRSSGRRLMSSTRAGVSTFSFIRSISVVPPPRKRTSAPCCAVVACAQRQWPRPDLLHRCTRSDASRTPPALRAPADLLYGRDDVCVGAAAADIAAHQLLDRSVIGSTWLL